MGNGATCLWTTVRILDGEIPPVLPRAKPDVVGDVDRARPPVPPG